MNSDFLGKKHQLCDAPIGLKDDLSWSSTWMCAVPLEELNYVSHKNGGWGFVGRSHRSKYGNIVFFCLKRLGDQNPSKRCHVKSLDTVFFMFFHPKFFFQIQSRLCQAAGFGNSYIVIWKNLFPGSKTSVVLTNL